MYEFLRSDQKERWQTSDPLTVESYLQRFPGLADELTSLVDLIEGEIELREARGEQPELDEYLLRFPQCAGQLRRQVSSSVGTVIEPRPRAEVPEVATNQNFETILSEPMGELATAAAAEYVAGPTIPGFELLGEIGRGGMGIVYKARQLSADRIVALKVVRNDVLQAMPLATRSSTLERFRHEARAAAKLEHDNLVTVFEVGETNGLSYYAMRYVEGKNLHEMLQAGPLDNRRAAAYLEPVARALHSAHERGILHRDLKPHNVIVDAHSDRPLLMDFGLAKFVEQQNELTHAGDVMGTPSYMSPEQTRDAGAVGVTADVYSLGATLYHVLTARPPFQAANIGETIRQINFEEPVSPRRLSPAIDRDLETICLKCLQKEPARRYATAELLADDLARYLNGQPIVARPLGIFGRTWRWCRRNPLLASLSAAAATFAVVSLLAIVVGYYQTAAALAKSESRLQMALQVVDELFTRVSEDELLNEPGMQPLRKDLLEKALKHYQYFLAESGGNAGLRDEVAAARFRVGLITQLVGSREAARQELAAARTMQRELLARKPDDVPRLKALADTLNALGSLNAQMGEWDEATASYTEAEEIRTQLTKLEPQDREYERLLANVRMNLGLVEMELAHADAARAQMQLAQDARLKLLAAEPNSSKVERDTAMGFYNLAKLALAGNDLTGAAEHLRQAIEHFERLVKPQTRALTNRYYLAVCYRLLGGLQADAGDIPAALASFNAALVHTAALSSGNPEVSLYQTELAALAINLGTLYGEQNDLPVASAAWTQARGALEVLVAREPRNPGHRLELAATLSSLGNIQLRSGDKVTAAVTLAQARDRLQRLLQEFPDDESLQQQLNETLADLAKCDASPKTTPAERE